MGGRGEAREWRLGFPLAAWWVGWLAELTVEFGGVLVGQDGAAPSRFRANEARPQRSVEILA